MEQQVTEEGRQPTVLVVDDELYIRRALERVLTRQGYKVLDADGGEAALRVASDELVDIALVDLRMPGMTGHEVLRALREHSPMTQCIMMTAFHTPHDAFEALHEGAHDYFEKPIEDWVRFNQILRKALQLRALERDNTALKQERDQLAERLDKSRVGEELIGNSAAMRRLKALVRDASRFPVPVLINGESGSGKERVARAIHNNSPRAEMPFVAVNCGALNPELVAAELFGAVEGGYTGAVDRAGLFRTADGGTLFLDEIGELELALQVKLLRVLQEGELTPVGSDKTEKVDVRVIAATHVDLEEAVSRGRFRQDLYYRMNLLQIRVPPLRERKDDIPLLAWFFLNRYSKQYDLPVARVDSKAMRALSEHDWCNNNVRELENAIMRAVIRAGGGELRREHFPDLGHMSPISARTPSAPSGGQRFDSVLLDLDYTKAKERLVQDFSQWYLRARLGDTGWNITRAAEMSGQARPNFKKLMKRFGVDKPPPDELDQKLKG